MELLINELSLTGQFSSIENFVEKGIPPMLELFRDLESSDEVYKKYEFFGCKVTAQYDIHTILTNTQSKMYDEVRRFKVFLSNLFEDPYWEENQKHSPQVSYTFNNASVSMTSMAEACERDRILISFCHPEFTQKKIVVNKGSEEISIHNLTGGGQFLEVCKEDKKIEFSTYCEKKFNKKSKLNFDSIDKREGFNLIDSEDDEVIFLSGFKKFDQLTWQQIIVDDGLDYKEYNKKGFYKIIETKKHKFRINQRYRCFGYVNNGVFNVLCFDLTHKLSD